MDFSRRPIVFGAKNIIFQSAIVASGRDKWFLC